jgi:hypothetical protein
MANGNGVDPILEQMLAKARRRLVEVTLGQSPIAIETPQLGRVVYPEVNVADLRMLIDQLEALVHPEAAYAFRRRRPLSIEACP